MTVPFRFLALLTFATLLACGGPSPNTRKPSESVDWTTKFEATDSTETVTYQEGIAYLKKLEEYFPDRLKLTTYGTTDAGLPLHLAVYSASGEFEPEKLRAEGKLVLMVNNAIHPGEPDGVDATLLLLRDALLKPEEALAGNLEDVVLITVPFYSIGGALNRSLTSRANQVGPKAYGFRGNANHLDLNRDFIKNDSENAKTFAQIYHEWQPHVYIENHVTNGADYQYVLTYLATQKDKLGEPLGPYLENELCPELERRMAARGLPICPYVNAWGSTPDKGYRQFMESPRYSTGYVALFGTLPFIVETHMLKPFAPRVEATYYFMTETLGMMAERKAELAERVAAHRKAVPQRTEFPLTWTLDTSQHRTFTFRGYAAEYRPSETFGGERLYYDRSQPIEAEIPFYNYYVPAKSVRKPYAYLVPQSRKEVIERFRLNGVQVQRFKADTEVPVTAYYIEDYQTRIPAYEGHYLHYDTEVRAETQTVTARAGDYIVKVDQPAARYVVETLEPEATDSFFNWNFFDEILQRKEGYSAYVFEEKAVELLESDAALRQAFEERKASDSEFAANRRAQLAFIYRRSPYHEKEYLRHPVFRVERASDLP